MADSCATRYQILSAVILLVRLSITFPDTLFPFFLSLPRDLSIAREWALVGQGLGLIVKHHTLRTDSPMDREFDLWRYNSRGLGIRTGVVTCLKEIEWSRAPNKV